MQALSDPQLAVISGGIEKGTVCGLMVGAMVTSWVLFGPLVGSLVFMFTPMTCALDLGRR